MRFQIQNHWRSRRANGFKPRPVYLLVSNGDGAIKAWNPSRRAIDVRLRAEWRPENWRVERLDPPANQ